MSRLIDRPVSRRTLLQSGAMAGLVMTVCPGLVLAQARTDQRLVVIILRGAMDGLAAVAPYGDPDYAALRGDLALSPDTVLKLDGRFGMHPSLKPLYDMFAAKELAIVHAAASPYRERSHFDAQNVLELGSTAPHTLQSGWLNRMVESINSKDPSLGLAIGESVPMMLRGSMHVASWAPSSMPGVNSDFMSLLSGVYQHDPIFLNALQEGQEMQDKSSDATHTADPEAALKNKANPQFIKMAEMAGQFLADPKGARLATLEIGGWDTHIQQGTEGGRLANNFDLLARGIAALKTSLGPAWSKTTVVMLTEFGRTAHPNGNRGTDHGTASVTMIAGGAVQGGIYGAWPGLSDGALREGRDLAPVTDIRAIMKGILNDQFGLSPATLSSEIYPGSDTVAKLNGLIKV